MLKSHPILISEAFLHHERQNCQTSEESIPRNSRRESPHHRQLTSVRKSTHLQICANKVPSALIYCSAPLMSFRDSDLAACTIARRSDELKPTSSSDDAEDQDSRSQANQPMTDKYG
eukprot:TRINITY_DN89048_c0_g1_i1.p1 TRINITY_DN89048_c0_g1~~TRINITY_DN89048_c0_g1_i1.p1  ORF type:complete len:117 (+),score=6.65 TRINITY_DN89048_c0_g1_i1:110-460(+)